MSGDDWLLWRVAQEMKVSIQEVKYEWTLKELLEAHELLDLNAKTERILAKEREAEIKNRRR